MALVESSPGNIQYQHVGVEQGFGLDNVQEVDSEFQFWARQLVPFLDEVTVIFASFTNSKFAKIQLLEVVQMLKEIDYFEAVEAINYAPHPKFIKISFDSPAMVEIFQDTVSDISGMPIKYVDKSILVSTCFISVANIAADLIPSLIGPQLRSWGSILKIYPQLIPKKNGKSVQIGQSRFEFKFNSGCSIADLPYFLKISGFKIFLYIRGRKKICFRCSATSHLVSSCSLRYCGLCRSLKEITHTCVLSYAVAASSGSVNTVLPIMHDRLLEQEDLSSELVLDVSPASSASGVDPELIGVSVAHEEQLVEVSGSVDPVAASCDVNMGSQDGVSKRMRTRSISKIQNSRSFKADFLSGKVTNVKQISPPNKKKRTKVADLSLDNLDPELSENAGSEIAGSPSCSGGKEEPPLSTSSVVTSGLDQAFANSKCSGVIDVQVRNNL